MHKRLFAIAGSGILVLGFALYGSQEKPQSDRPGGGRAERGRGQMSPDDQLQRLSETLNLTDDQKTQILPILKNRQEEMQKLRSDSSMSREDRMTKMRSIMEESNKKIRAVLNDDQKQKYDEMQQKMRERMQQRREGAEKK